MTGRIFKFAVLLCSGLFPVAGIFAADVSISASADRQTVTLNESVRVAVTVTGGMNLPAPQALPMPDFSIYSAGTSQNVSFVNGKMSSSITHTYSFAPKRLGKFTLGPFSVTADGQTVQSQPIEVEVTASPAAAPAPQQGAAASKASGAFIKMWLDRPQAFVNEQVILTFRFYYRVPLVSNPEYQPPKFSGFIAEDLPPPRHFKESANGAEYQVTEVKAALFPLREGEFTIEPATLKIRVEDVRAPSADDAFNDDFFRSFFRGGGREYMLQTEPVRLKVLPLPSAGKPAQFSGAVGNFGVSAALDRSKLAVGEPLMLSVAVTGSGNIKSLGDPEFPEFKGFRKYDTASSLNTDNAKGHIEGSKVYTVMLVPNVSGIQSLPPVQFSYFDLREKKYKTLSTRPLSVEVVPSQSTGVVVSPFGSSLPEIREIGQEIRYVKAGNLPSRPFRWIVSAPWFLVLALLPLAGILGAAGFRLRRIILERDPEKRRASLALKNALKDLKNSKEASEILDTVRGYFADKMNGPVSGLSFRTVESALEKAGVPESERQELSSFWSGLEIAVYAPAQFRSMDGKKVLEDAERLLRSIDRAFSNNPDAWKKMAVLILSLVCIAGAVHAGTDAEKKFADSNRAFQEGRFEEARSGYAELEKDFSSFILEYDLGNACYQSGRSGEAVLHWARAWRMDPRDSDVRHNLALVSAQTGSPFFPANALMRMLHSLFYALNFNELSILFLIFFWLAGIVWVRAVLRNGSVKRSGWIVTAVFAILLIWWGSRFIFERARVLAVVTAQKAEVRSGPGARFGVGFTVPEGQRVLMLGTPSDPAWEEVGVPEKGLRGWVESGAIRKI